jgi:adenine-specific DNA-methyltransferase
MMPEKDLLKEIAQLKAELKLLKKDRKYGLIWEEKPEDIVLESSKIIPVLKEVKIRKLNKSKNTETNFLIEGDNYHSLSVLNYTHRNKIDVIYIDPPYNTGATDWRYNNDYVDENDQWRHSKWISFMNHRLCLARNLLSPSGVLVCTIDDNEQEALGLLLRQIFPEKDITCVTIVHNPAGIQGNNFSYTHEYAYFVYPKGGRSIAFQERDEDPDIRPLRNVSTGDVLRETAANCFYPIFVKEGKIVGFGDVPEDSFHPKSVNVLREDGVIEIYPIDPSGNERKWVFARQSVEKIRNELSVEFNKNRKIWDIIRRKSKFPFRTVWVGSKYSANNNGTQLLNQILDSGSFSFPKSLYAVEECLVAASNDNKNALILDFFAGSGTTGHAVLKLNKADGGNRRFILCTNNENKICEEVTYERIKRVINGYENLKTGKSEEGLGGNLTYYKTEIVEVEKLHKISDEARIKVAYQAGEMIAVRENTLDEIEKNEWWQIFQSADRATAIYFKEDKTKLTELVNRLEKKGKPTALYIFSWGKNEYTSEYSSSNIRVEDIPEPIIGVYKEINSL